MVKRSKKYREAAEKVDRNNLYTANEAIALLKSMPAYNFDQTVEAVYRLSVDPRKADQLVRGTVNLPHGTGKTAKVAVFARGPKATVKGRYITKVTITSTMNPGVPVDPVALA